jgi:glutamate-ammonia-ligase adenylyltransferase
LVFPTDARLRPDGEKGLLVNSINAYEDYYRQRAQLWEIQALTRVRRIAGDLATGETFQKLAGRLTNFKKPSPPLSCLQSNPRIEIARMRFRIERERTPPGKEALAIKTGAGGLIDAEFIAQLLCLEQGWQEPNTLTALQRCRDESVIPVANAQILIENYRHLRRIEGILRRWSYAGEVLLPEDPAAMYRVAVRCGFKTADAFLSAVKEYRGNIRKVYLTIFPETCVR